VDDEQWGSIETQVGTTLKDGLGGEGRGGEHQQQQQQQQQELWQHLLEVVVVVVVVVVVRTRFTLSLGALHWVLLIHSFCYLLLVLSPPPSPLLLLLLLPLLTERRGIPNASVFWEAVYIAAT